MWNFLSNSSNKKSDRILSASRPHIPQRQADDDLDATHYPTAVDAAISETNIDRDRGLNPTSTSFSSTSQVAHPNTAGASVASSHATAFANSNENSYSTPVLNRNRSLADKMPKSTTSSRGGRDRESDSTTTKSKSSSKSGRDDDNGQGEKKSKRDRGESKSTSKSGEKSRSMNGSFEDQRDEGTIGSSRTEQNNSARPPEHEALSSHVQDQFPGQFPSETAEPYRPPMAASEGGPGLAADYYGDTGQSVADQPGFRKHSPSLIIGQEPHLLPASSVAAPPPEPSASGGVGAAASFYSGEFDADEQVASHADQASSTYSTAPSRPNTATTSSALPSLGGAAIGTTAAMGAAAAYALGSHSSSSQQQQQHQTSSSEYFDGSSTVTDQRPQSQSQGSYHSTSSRPPTSGSRPSHIDNIPVYAAAAAGVAGLAGAVSHHSDHQAGIHASATQQFATPTTPRHRHRGPFGALVDFVKDPEGVAQFEEYSEYVGICRGCFEPGSSPRDAPRRHRRFNRKRSDERIGRTSRVEKNRRDSSGDEKRDTSWLGAGIAGYGLGKMGEGLFKQTKDFDDSYSVKSGRYSPDNDRKHQNRRGSGDESRRRRTSEGVLETGITGVTGDRKDYINNSDIFGAAASKHSNRVHTRSRSGSRDRASKLSGPAVGIAVDASNSRRAHRNGSESDSKRRSHRKKEKKAEKRGFFSFGSNSSSSSLDKAHSRRGKSSKSKNDDTKAEAALLGLGAAAAALAAANSGSGHRKNGVKELVGRKETRDERFQRPSADDAGWEDEEDYISEAGSVDSGLAFGAESDGSFNSRRRRSEMSGKGSLPGRRTSWDNGRPAMTGPSMSPKYAEESSQRERPNGPLQYVDPAPIPDFEHLNERMEESQPFQTRPPLVSHRSEDTPFHQPQPKSRVSSSIYTAQSPPSSRANRSYEDEFGAKDAKLSRRATLPARFEPENTPTESSRRRKPSVKDDSSTVSGVRFALPEDDGDERREKRRRRKDSDKADRVDRDRQEGDREAPRERASKKGSEVKDLPVDGSVNSSSSSWVAPAAIGLAGAAIGAAAIAEGRTDSNRDEAKEERRERRRREKQRENDEEEDSRKERRRREKGADMEEIPAKSESSRNGDRDETREERKARRRAEREEGERKEGEDDVAASTGPRVSFGKLPRRADDDDEREIHPNEQETPAKHEAYKHEDYSSFFTPAIDDTNNQEVKIEGANADADISFDQSPNFVIAEPREFRDKSGTPEFSPADTVDRVEQSLKFPWQVPRLRLLYPTPPSSRGSTPIIEPREMPEQEPENTPVVVPHNETSSTSRDHRKSTKDDGVSPDNTPVSRDRYTDPPSDDDSERRRRRKPKKIPLSIDQEDPTADTGSYGNDNSFAAVLAASAEDAGFDPSIVMDNPVYRRRDSPPGSKERNMPGGFDENTDEPIADTNERASSRSKYQKSQEERDNNAIVENIIGQVEEQDIGKDREDPKVNDVDISSVSSKKSKKSKKGSRRSVVNDEPNDQEATEDQNGESRSAIAASVLAASILTNDDENHVDTRALNGKKESTGEAAASGVDTSVEASTSSKSNGPKKGSIWDRVLGKTATNSSGPNEDVDSKREVPEELSRRDSKKGKKSKRKSVQSLQSLEDVGGEGTDGGQNGDSRVIRSVNSPPESVAQYLIRESDPEQSQEPVTESFLGERPDPPPPPDIGKTPKEILGMTAATDPQDSDTHNPLEKHSKWPAEIGTSDGSLSPKAVSSPTAVPIHFRRPTLPKARSSSQSPLSSTRIADDGAQAPTPRPRPRSTQFENSKEYRPLWLVERNQSRQETARDETYPPLPSSHSTSRDSSLDPSDRQGDQILPEVTLAERGEHLDSLQDSDDRILQSDLLDSQQPTPTASSFPHTSVIQEPPASSISRSSSPTKDQRSYEKHDISDLKLAGYAAAAGGIAALSAHEVGKNRDSSISERPQPESTDRPEKDERLAQDEVEDLLPQKKKKKKSKKDKASKELTEPPSAAISEETGILADHGSKIISSGDTGVSDAPSEQVERDIHPLVGPSILPGIGESKKVSSDNPVDPMILSKDTSHYTDEGSEFFPLSTPLPEGDDSDLLSEPPRSDGDATLGPVAKDDPISLVSTAEKPEQNEHLETRAEPTVLRVSEVNQDETHSTQAAPSGYFPEVSRSLEDTKLDDLKLAKGSSQQDDVMEPVGQDLGNNGAAEDEDPISTTKKKGKKGKKAKQSLAKDSASEDPQVGAQLDKASILGATSDGTLAKSDGSKEVQSSNPLPDSGLADDQDIEMRNDAPASLDAQPIQDDPTSLSSKKKNKKDKKDKKKKKIVSFDEEDPLENAPVDPNIPASEDPEPSAIVERELEEHRKDNGHPIEALATANLGSQANEETLNGPHDRSLELNRDADQAADRTTERIISSHEDDNEESDALQRDPKLPATSIDDSRILRASPEFSSTTIGSDKNVLISTPVEDEQVNDSRAVDDVSANEPALADNREATTVSDEKGHHLPQEDGPPIEMSERSAPTKEPVALDVSPGDLELPEDNDFAEFPIKKSKKEKKGKKSKKGEDTVAQESIGTKAVEALAILPIVAGGLPEAAKEEDPSEFVPKASKKDKKGKKKNSSKSTTPAPIEELDDDLAYGQAEAPSETRGVEIVPVSVEADDLPLSSKSAIPSLDEDEKDVEDDFSIKKSKKDKKGKKDKKKASSSFAEMQAPEDILVPDKSRALSENDDVIGDSLENTKPAAALEDSREGDPAEEIRKKDPPDEAFESSKSKKGKKKNKKSKASSWDDDADQASKDEENITKSEPTPDATYTDANEQGKDIDRQLSEEAREEYQEVDEKGTMAKESDGQIEAKKSSNFLWGAFDSRGPETTSLANTKTPDDTSSKRENSDDKHIADDQLEGGLVQNSSKIINSGDSEVERTYLLRSNPDDKLDTDDRHDITSLRSNVLEANVIKSESQDHAWDETASAEKNTVNLSRNADLERSESSAYVKADAIESPTFERTQSSFHVAIPLAGPVVQAVQSPSDVPKDLTFDDIVEPTMVEEPRESSAKAKLHEANDEPSAAYGMEETNPDLEVPTVKKSKKGKKSKKAKFVDFESVDEKPTDFQQDQQDKIGSQEVDLDQKAIRAEGHQSYMPNDLEDDVDNRPAIDDSKYVRKGVHINDTPEIIESSYSQSSQAPTHKKFSPPDTPLSAGSVDMLDPDEQREYNEEYRKQLEKELSPLQVETGTLNAEEQNRDGDIDRKDFEYRSSLYSEGSQDILPEDLASHQVFEHSVIDESDESKLATREISPHQTSLSAIAEEPQSNPSSLPKAPTNTDDRLERKKSKKGKKSKQKGKPVIWEDDTATQGLAGDADRSTQDGEVIVGSAEDGQQQDEGRVVYHDLPSPTRGSPAASRSPKFDDAAEDYFTVKPRTKADSDIGEGIRSDQPSPEQSQDLPDWSSQPKEFPMMERGDDQSMPEQPRRHEKSASLEDRSSDNLVSQGHARQESPPPYEEQTDPSSKRESVGEIAIAVAAGAGIVGATAISRKESKKAKKDGKKKKSARTVDLEASGNDDMERQDEDLINTPQRHESAMNPHEIPDQDIERPHKSPDHTTTSRNLPTDSQQEEQPNYRDSAIQIADSPVIHVPELVHRPQHDSGYPGTEASPVINTSNDYEEEDHAVVDPYTDPRISPTGFYHEDDKRPISIASDLRYSGVESDDQEALGDRQRTKRRSRRRESNVAYDSDDSNDSGYDKQRRLRKIRQNEEAREPSPVSSTTKNRSSALFDSSPLDRQTLEQHNREIPKSDRPHDDEHAFEVSNGDDKAALMPEHQNLGISDGDTDKPNNAPKSIFGGPVREEERSRSRSPTDSDARSRRQLERISEDSLENSPLARKGKRDVGDIGLPEYGVKARRTSRDLSPLMTGMTAGTAAIDNEDLLKRLHKTPREDDDQSLGSQRSANRDHHDRPRRLSNQSNNSGPVRDSEWRRQALKSPDSIHAIIRTPPDQVRSSSGQSIRSSGTPPLRRVDRSISGDLRGASLEIDAKRRAKLAEPEPAILGAAAEAIASSSTYDPLTDKGKSRGGMAEIYEGEGQRVQSPMSPTRPQSMRKRQSMQFADLEQRFEQLAADHRSLQSAKLAAERRLDEQVQDHSQQRETYEQALQEHKSYLAEKNSELSRLHEILDGFKRQVAELTTVNEELQTSRGLDPNRVGDQSFQILASQHETTKKELEGLREQHSRLANDHEDILEREVEAIRREKDYELQQLVEELENAKAQVKTLQEQIITSQSAEDYVEHDEDYFESKCTALCQHVQQWVLRFSKFSDSHACRLVGELGDDTLSDLFDDAILDGTEVDDYLQDRIKRRDIFMSVVMSRIFDFIFRRYLFGLDREQRKKLKDLDATLTDVGPQSAVHKWRSTTLTLLSSRPEFADQREEDTEGVVDSIFQTLAAILPPKKELVPQITDSLRRVVSMAVDLHIEMRLQRAEFQMLPPLKPQFDPTTGDLARKVPFNATMMNERSGNTESNEQLQDEGVVIRMVLFPLVVKNSDDEEQIVVCPAQVIVAKDEPRKKGSGKQVRVMSAQGARSEASFVGTEDTRMSVEGEMF